MSIKFGTIIYSKGNRKLLIKSCIGSVRIPNFATQNTKIKFHKFYLKKRFNVGPKTNVDIYAEYNFKSDLQFNLYISRYGADLH
jgi:hypothetical protein